MKRNCKPKNSMSLFLWLLLCIVVGSHSLVSAKDAVKTVSKEDLKKAKPASGKPAEVKAPEKSEEEKKQEALAKKADEGDDQPQQEDVEDDSAWKPEVPGKEHKVGTWTLVDSGEIKLTKVSVGDTDTIFGIADNKVYRLEKDGWKDDKMQAVLVSAAYDDTVFAINEKNEVFQRKGIEKWEQVKDLKLSHIAAASKANVWAVGANEKEAFQIKEGKAVAVNNALSEPAKGMEMFAPAADGRVLGFDGKVMSLRTLDRLKVIEETKSLRKGLKGRWKKKIKKINKQIKKLKAKKKARKKKKKKLKKKDRIRLRKLKRKRNRLRKRLARKKGKRKKKRSGKKKKKNKKKRKNKKNKKNKKRKNKKKKRNKKKKKAKKAQKSDKDDKGPEAKTE